VFAKKKDDHFTDNSMVNTGKSPYFNRQSNYEFFSEKMMVNFTHNATVNMQDSFVAVKSFTDLIY